MSQAGLVAVTDGILPPDVPESFVTDSGTAVPALHILNVNGADTNINNDNGIRVIANPTLSNNLLIQLTNRLTGSATTTNATPTTLISVSLGSTPGVYYVEGDIVAYNVTDAAGAAYSFAGAAVTDGATATEIATEEKDIFEQAANVNLDFNLGVTGNTAFIQIIGIAGKTVDWSGLLTYRFVG